MRKTVLLSLAVLLSIMAVAQQKPLSPRQQSQAKLGNGKTVSVDYGAPSMRGRKIMGQLVPYGKVWRTGANEATKFHTDADLMVGGTKVPAGDYTLYTLPGEGVWKLIINKQTGQWGTAYDEKQDLTRVPMKVEKAAKANENFTINFEDTKDGGLLTAQWGTEKLSTPFMVH